MVFNNPIPFGFLHRPDRLGLMVHLTAQKPSSGCAGRKPVGLNTSYETAGHPATV